MKNFTASEINNVLNPIYARDASGNGDLFGFDQGENYEEIFSLAFELGRLAERKEVVKYLTDCVGKDSCQINLA